MISLQSCDLLLKYKSNNQRKKRVSLEQVDFEYFNKFKRQPVANLINVYSMEHSICNNPPYIEVEKIIREYLPEHIATYDVALDWLLENNIYETLIKANLKCYK